MINTWDLMWHDFEINLQLEPQLHWFFLATISLVGDYNKFYWKFQTHHTPGISVGLNKYGLTRDKSFLKRSKQTEVSVLGCASPTGDKKWKLLSYVQLFVTPWSTQSMEFSRPQYWSG